MTVAERIDHDMGTIAELMSEAVAERPVSAANKSGNDRGRAD